MKSSFALKHKLTSSLAHLACFLTEEDWNVTKLELML